VKRKQEKRALLLPPFLVDRRIEEILSCINNYLKSIRRIEPLDIMKSQTFLSNGSVGPFLVIFLRWFGLVWWLLTTC